MLIVCTILLFTIYSILKTHILFNLHICTSTYVAEARALRITVVHNIDIYTLKVSMLRIKCHART